MNGWWGKPIIQIEGILPKGPYPPCLHMADRALLAGYPRNVPYPVSYDSQSKHVRRPCDRLLLAGLWRHEVEALRGHKTLLCSLLRTLGDVVVSQDCMVVCVQEDVCRVDAAMDQPLFVNGRDALQEVTQDLILLLESKTWGMSDCNFSILMAASHLMKISGGLAIKMVSYQHRHSHHKCKSVWLQSYLYTSGDFLYRNGVQKG